jgi:hypothetical protein
MAGCVYGLAVLLIILWIVGFVLRYFVTPLVHLFLIVGLILLVYQLVTQGNRR